MTVGQLPGLVKSVSWRAWIVGYLLWVIAFTVVDGAGRQVCRMPMQKWIDAAANPRDRDARVWFRDRANECLHITRWYSWSVAALFTLGLIAPLGGAWISRSQQVRDSLGRTPRAGVSQRVSDLEPKLPSDFKTAATASVFLFVVSLAVTLGTMMAVRWAYDHLG